MPYAPITVQETSVFARRAEALLSADERTQLIDFLANNPLAGDLIEGTGGVRKVRFAAKGRGKSGGVRVIYYYYSLEVPLIALLVYGKNEQANLTAAQKRAVSQIAVAAKAAASAAKRRT